MHQEKEYKCQSCFQNNSVSIEMTFCSETVDVIEDCTGFNWFFDKEGNKNMRKFTTGFIYKLKVVDLHSDSIAVTKITELSYPYVKIRAGDQIRVD